MYQNIIYAELQESQELINDFIKKKENIYAIQNSAILIAKSFNKGGKIISCGNGGSHCDAMHFTEELMGKYRKKRVGYPAIVISDPSYISCVSNDFGYQYVFSHYIEAIGKPQDILLIFSTSGNSVNLLHAIQEAKKIGMKIISLNGNTGGKIKGKSDIEICIPHLRYSDRIQEMHIKIVHIIVLLIEKEMTKNLKQTK
ncbi:D-sedoheptulose 7-phosphate isomerase [Candidatus Tachikawaea gelatinosa]|uniref:Phosphoheptose isomerase n=1 Tax=Candidatus Tachikawaea gelatinosa TaxID=1410383 RepID=A0A090BWL5_9ENTR|nr:D-sedoheptulose 7-phosphate isomerase [Candidatus Tachikawaea gelatinosa]BAP58816.1 phosphoheptose isomerase [Candidatus Tachikawaea gelatinosa]